MKRTGRGQQSPFWAAYSCPSAAPWRRARELGVEVNESWRRRPNQTSPPRSAGSRTSWGRRQVKGLKSAPGADRSTTRWRSGGTRRSPARCPWCSSTPGRARNAGAITYRHSTTWPGAALVRQSTSATTMPAGPRWRSSRASSRRSTGKARARLARLASPVCGLQDRRRTDRRVGPRQRGSGRDGEVIITGNPNISGRLRQATTTWRWGATEALSGARSAGQGHGGGLAQPRRRGASILAAGDG